MSDGAFIFWVIVGLIGAAATIGALFLLVASIAYQLMDWFEQRRRPGYLPPARRTQKW